MAVGNQDGRSVPVPRPVLLGGLDEPLDLSLGQIFAAALANCYIYCGWSPLAKPCAFQEIALPPVRTVTDFDGRVTESTRPDHRNARGRP